MNIAIRTALATALLAPFLLSSGPAFKPSQDCAAACSLTPGEAFSGEFTLNLSLIPKENGTGCRVFARMCYEPDATGLGLVGQAPGSSTELSLIDFETSGEAELFADCTYGESATGWARSGQDGPLLASWTFQ
jgi:hypothetical protein